MNRISGKGMWPRPAIVDEQDFWLFAEHNWSFSKGSYLCTTIGGKSVKLHRLISGAARGEIVDHINGDIMDNRRCNLRVVSHAENISNSGKKYGSHEIQSRHRGVSWDASRNKWRARYMDRQIGRFDSEDEAALAYNAALDAANDRFKPRNLVEGACHVGR